MSWETPSLRLVDPHPERGQRRPLDRPTALSPRGLAATVTMLSVQLAAVHARNRQLAETVQQLRGERSELRSRVAALRNAQPTPAPSPSSARLSEAGLNERQRLERDLHDGAQNELVSLLVRLTRAEEDHGLSPALARTFAGLADHALAALASVREAAHGIYPAALASFGVKDALRARAARASIEVLVAGTVPRGSEDAEAAIYFSCSEAIQNIQKHAGHGARASLRLDHHDGVLTARIEDDGPGFDPARTPHGAGLRNVHHRIQSLGGTIQLESGRGRGTVLTISLPWPTGS